MIVVITDTSPIRYLVRIGEIDLLKKLYDWRSAAEAAGNEIPGHTGAV